MSESVEWTTIKESPSYPNKGDQMTFVKANKPRPDPDKAGRYLIRTKDDKLIALWQSQLQPIARVFTETKYTEANVTFAGYTTPDGKEYVRPIIGTCNK